jgi:hypothetical protein
MICPTFSSTFLPQQAKKVTVKRIKFRARIKLAERTQEDVTGLVVLVSCIGGNLKGT